jgi:hypothetical protein
LQTVRLARFKNPAGQQPRTLSALGAQTWNSMFHRGEFRY